MSFQFLITDGAKGDIHACAKVDPKAGAKIAVLLREIMDNRRSSEALIDEHISDDVIESVEPVWSLHDLRINAYRVRVVEVSAWRLITGIDNNRRRIALFAVMPRKANYQQDKPLWKRIETEYERIEFPRY